MLSTFANREKFVNSVIALLRTHGFDGLDLFFLYPGLRGSPRCDRWTFVFLLEVLDKELPSKGPMVALSLCHIRALAQPSSLSDAFSLQLLDSLRLCFVWFSRLLAFRKEAQLTMRPRLLLSAAVSGDPRVIQKAYDVHLLGRFAPSSGE
eukprot:bmy_20749T0